MAIVNFSNPGSPITTADIEKIEALVGLRFPEDYKQHMLRYNGGDPEPNVYSFIEDGRGNASDARHLYTIYRVGEDRKYYRDIEWVIDVYKIDEKRMPTHILPIGGDSGGNNICLSCGPDDYGYVYFWDHENEVDYSESDDNDYSNMYLIAKSFTEFLEGLRESS